MNATPHDASPSQDAFTPHDAWAATAAVAAVAARPARRSTRTLAVFDTGGHR